jgi:hypothetical protein
MSSLRVSRCARGLPVVVSRRSWRRRPRRDWCLCPLVLAPCSCSRRGGIPCCARPRRASGAPLGATKPQQHPCPKRGCAKTAAHRGQGQEMLGGSRPASGERGPPQLRKTALAEEAAHWSSEPAAGRNEDDLIKRIAALLREERRQPAAKHPCRDFAAGRCTRGAACRFSHLPVGVVAPVAPTASAKGLPDPKRQRTEPARSSSRASRRRAASAQPAGRAASPPPPREEVLLPTHLQQRGVGSYGHSKCREVYEDWDISPIFLH